MAAAPITPCLSELAGLANVRNISLIAGTRPCNRSAARPPPYTPQATAAFAVTITLMILLTIVGNVLVIMAVLTSRSLRGAQNLFLVSLAAADILVATLIIPFSLANELQGFWAFGEAWCHVYLALDVLFCTSSIVHLCAIALDRYLSISRPVSYGTKRTAKRIKAAIVVVWLISAVISFPPLLTLDKRDGGEEVCQLNGERWYILYSTIGSFFAPCVIMILVYVRIYQIAKRHTRGTAGLAQAGGNAGSATSDPRTTTDPRTISDPRTTSDPFMTSDPHAKDPGGGQEVPGSQRRSDPGSTLSGEAAPCPRPTLQCGARAMPAATQEPPAEAPTPPACFDSDADLGIDEVSDQEKDGGGSGGPDPSRGPRATVVTPSGTRLALEWAPGSRRKTVMHREKRFTVVLAVVMGVFVLCWFPFFLSYSLQAVCPAACAIPTPLFKFFFWIGYCNSCLNPVIYTIFNHDFRKAFKRIVSRDTNGTVFQTRSTWTR